VNVNNKNIFLIDGIGALISSILLGVVLPLLQELVGMPLQTLYLLAGLAVVFMLYSLTCFKFSNPKDHKWLRLIIKANLLYCTLTAFLVFHHYGELSLIGISYFLGEIVVILGLVSLEQRVIKAN